MSTEYSNFVHKDSSKNDDNGFIFRDNKIYWIQIALRKFLSVCIISIFRIYALFYNGFGQQILLEIMLYSLTFRKHTNTYKKKCELNKSLIIHK